MTTVNDMQDRVAPLARAAHVVAFTGAGVSKESGLATFREADGVWQTYDPQEYATLEGFRRHPREVWRWYQARRRKMVEVEPNLAHEAIAELEEIFPRVVVVTQNIDGLHQEAGSERVLELHGTARRYKCLENCRGDPTVLSTPPPEQEEPARCPHCGAYARPDVVWFNEMLPMDVWEAAAREMELCDALIVVGTSGTVEPAASLPWRARAQGAFIVEVNPEATPITHIADVSLRGAAGLLMPALVEAVRHLREGS